MKKIKISPTIFSIPDLINFPEFASSARDSNPFHSLLVGRASQKGFLDG
jgi:hypothetical protein